MLLGKKYDPSLYLMMKGDKKTKENIKMMIDQIPNSMLEEMRKHIIGFPLENNETILESYEGKNIIHFSYSIDSDCVDIILQKRIRGILRNSCWITLFDINGIEMSDLTTKDVGEFGEVVDYGEHSLSVIDNNYIISNTRVGCFLHEYRRDDCNGYKTRKSTYPISLMKFYESVSKVEDEENNMILRKDK